MFRPTLYVTAPIPWKPQLCALGLFQACLGAPENVILRFQPPPAVDPSDVTLVLLPFDLDALIDSVGGASPIPKPDFGDLEREMRGLRTEDPDQVEDLESEWRTLRNRITELADSLGDTERTEPGYAAAYGRLRTLYADLTARESELERRLRALMSSDQVRFAQRALSSSDSLRAWERGALANLPRAIEAESARTGRQTVMIDWAEGTERHEHLAPGRWWVVLRVTHPENTFLEYYWSVPFSVNRLVPVVVPIGPRNTVIRWRH